MKASSRPRRNRFVQIGPKAVPNAPISAFTKARKFNGKPMDELLEEIWELVGPSFELNMRRLPLWKVVAMAYFEGALHAAQMMEEENETS